jgi:isoleucyl-tRNA synthetase
MTLFTALETLSKLTAPFIPFMAEDIYRNLVVKVDSNAPESVHLCDFPVANKNFIDSVVEEQMAIVLKAVVAGRAARNGANIKNRQPLPNMFVKNSGNLNEDFAKIIREELNVKAVELSDDVSEFTTYSFKPQLRTVGPKYGKYLNQIRKALSEVDGGLAMTELKAQGHIAFDFDGFEVTLAEEDLLIDSAKIEGYASVVDGDMTVVLDTNLTEELLEEGFVREIISKIQTMRKEAGFEVTDHIHFGYAGNDKVTEVIIKNLDLIQDETLINATKTEQIEGYSKNWNINGEMVDFVVAKA